MTVSYNADIGTGSYWSFLKVIFRWKGSVWKSIWQELTIWIILYYVMMVLYKYVFSEEWHANFNKFATFIEGRLGLFQLTFILGFFVSTVVDRWKTVFNNIGFIDDVSLFVCNSIRGDDKETTTVRKNIVRYLCLTQVLVLRDIALSVRKRFPNMESLVTAGFLLPHELDLMEKETSPFQKYWMPVNWSFNLCYYMKAKGKVWADNLLNGLLGELKNYRASLQTLFNTDSVPIPLVYPQVVMLATRVYFLLCIFSRQYIIDEKSKNRDIIDEWIPFMTIFQIIFYMGWLKVAEALMNPLGLDDDDFECNFIIDRNVAISTLMADKHAGEYPLQMHDNLHYFKFPLYSEESARSMNINKLMGSVELAKMVEESLRVRMIPHYGYEMAAKSRGQSVLSTLTTPFRRVANSILSQEKGVDNLGMDYVDVEAGTNTPRALASHQNTLKSMSNILVKIEECSTSSSESGQS